MQHLTVGLNHHSTFISELRKPASTRKLFKPNFLILRIPLAGTFQYFKPSSHIEAQV